ncbi:MAG: DUF1697 domain-containing protein [Arenicella sp.]
MIRYIALLRGINVGGHKKVKMADLRAAFESAGFTNVSTYIQSGNILFDTQLDNTVLIQQQIENLIEQRFGFPVPVTLRTQQQWQAVMDSFPFGNSRDIDDGTQFLVVFLSAEPVVQSCQVLEQQAKEPERLKVIGSSVYLHCPNGYGRTRLTNNLIEKVLQVSATTRNWKTLEKLKELAAG